MMQGRGGGKSKFSQSIYEVTNHGKYMGATNPFYRSSWEYRMMYYLDHNKNVLKWNSENIVIPYKWVDGKIHRYYTDFYVEVKNREGGIDKLVIEVKPKDQCPGSDKIPKPPRKKTAKAMKNYQDKLIALKRNELKWESAKEYCKKRGYTFTVITEDDLFVKKK